MVTTANFGFLGSHDANLAILGGLAERYFQDDPPTSLVKLRQFAELLAKLIAAHHEAYFGERESFEETLRRLSYERVLPREVADLFHHIRKLGNLAAHEVRGTHADALTTLKVARQLAVWFHRTYGKQPSFNPGAFVPPPDPVDATASLRADIAALRQKMAETESAAEQARRLAEAEAHARETLEDRLKRETEEKALWEQLAQETEAAKNEVAAKLASIQAQAEQAPKAEAEALVAQSEVAAKKIDLDEAETRALIDQQLRDRGWEADTKLLRYSDGVRPAKGRNMAIAEWPTKNGPADYALFVGTKLMGLVEAKRQRKNVSAAIDQAERYAKGLSHAEGGELAGGPWHGHAVPFVFAANGRPYLKQIETESGIWFRDTRRPSNHRRALVDWPTPDGLLKRLEVDEEAATEALKTQPFEFGFPLRDYQREAIKAIEDGLEAGQRAMLAAMATGTGKTKLAIALLYRLLSAKRFQRICFVVDRSALGHQTQGEFSTTKVVSGKTFAEIFGLKGLADVSPDAETKVHICTIQGLVRRVLYQEDASEAPPIDQYDLIVVDECHRGYLLDRELSDAELSFRGQEDYISKYRRVLDYFDAVKIGLTATPALHTTDIFGDPIFTYSYRDAVIDGYLIDHEPPIQIETVLSRGGICPPSALMRQIG
jgi:type I restriction enzyme R subunit